MMRERRPHSGSEVDGPSPPTEDAIPAASPTVAVPMPPRVSSKDDLVPRAPRASLFARAKAFAKTPRGRMFIIGWTLVKVLFLIFATRGAMATGGESVFGDIVNTHRQMEVLSGQNDRNLGDFVNRHSDWKHFYVALNLYNNEALLPSFTKSMEETFTRVLLPQVKGVASRIVVSVFSNGNSDRTSILIDDEFVPMLKRTGVSYVVRSRGRCFVGGDPKGFERRPQDMDRIEWMACLRNAALTPLYAEGMALFDNAAAPHIHETFSATKGIGAPVTKQAPKPIRVDDRVAVLFFNDIYFRARDVADLITTQEGKFDLACGMDYYYSFDDTWVTRDIDGARFDPLPPFASHAITKQAIAAKAEAQITCCWNGVAAMRGDIFFTAAPASTAAHDARSASRMPVRFRRNDTNDECYASECQLLCQDMIDNGMRRIFLNPRVRVTYEEYFDHLQHGAWWYSQDLLNRVVSWVRVWTWPVFTTARSTSKLQCVSVAETYTLSVGQTAALTACFSAVVVTICCVTARMRRRRRLLKPVA